MDPHSWILLVKTLFEAINFPVVNKRTWMHLGKIALEEPCIYIPILLCSARKYKAGAFVNVFCLKQFKTSRKTLWCDTRPLTFRFGTGFAFSRNISLKDYLRCLRRFVLLIGYIYTKINFDKLSKHIISTHCGEEVNYLPYCARTILGNR